MSNVVHADSAAPFFTDTSPISTPDVSGWYIRNTPYILGEIIEEPELCYTTRCFNCGSTDHVKSTCPSPLNPELVALSRQFFDFTKGDRPNFERIHVVEEWRRQRLEWLDEFEPGEIHGKDLINALGSSGASEWLRNMALWGYPRGWTGAIDPRYYVQARILSEHVDADSEDEPDIQIVGDEEVESIRLTISGDDGKVQEKVVQNEMYASDHRWARFPNSHFSPYVIPIYNGLTLLPIMPLPPSPPPQPPSKPPPLPPMEEDDSDMELSDEWR